MIVLLGSSGYYGGAFAAELRRRGQSFIPLTRSAFDYTRFDYLFDYLRNMKPEFLINAGGYACPPEQEGSEKSREQAMLANALLPQMIARVCLMTKTPWGHVSSGSIFSGAKVMEYGESRIERDLSRPGLREQFDQHPEQFIGFNELDEPNYSFRHPPVSFYSGTKALAEEAIRDLGSNYIWRLRLPFDEKDTPCNLLSQIQSQPRLLDTVDSISHLGDCIRACLELWNIRAPYGIYNVTNPGAVTLRRLGEGLLAAGKLTRLPEFTPASEVPASALAKTPQSHCILDVSKLLATGIKLRTSDDAVQDSLQKMRQASRSGPSVRTVPRPFVPPT